MRGCCCVTKKPSKAFSVGALKRVVICSAQVHCLFYKPASGAETSPEKAVNSYIDHLAVKGMKLHPAYAEGMSVFYSLLETRKPGLQGAWSAQT